MLSLLLSSRTISLPSATSGRRADFPWMGIWEENCSRQGSPWNRKTITRGMEFGVSPFPESRREMVDRNRTLDTPGFKWLPSKGLVEVEYWILTQQTDLVPESLSWRNL